MTDEDETRRYNVVVNDAGQYSIWDAERPLPSGWRAEGFEGTRAACLSHVEEVWTDITPLGVRRHPDATGA